MSYIVTFGPKSCTGVRLGSCSDVLRSLLQGVGGCAACAIASQVPCVLLPKYSVKASTALSVVLFQPGTAMRVGLEPDRRAVTRAVMLRLSTAVKSTSTCQWRHMLGSLPMAVGGSWSLEREKEGGAERSLGASPVEIKGICDDHVGEQAQVVMRQAAVLCARCAPSVLPDDACTGSVVAFEPSMPNWPSEWVLCGTSSPLLATLERMLVVDGPTSTSGGAGAGLGRRVKRAMKDRIRLLQSRDRRDCGHSTCT